MIRRIIGKLYEDIVRTDKLHKPLDKLGAMALILRSVIQVQDQGMGLKPRLKLRPQILQTIHNKIGRNRARGQKEPGIRRGGEQTAKQAQFGLRRKIMIDRGGRTAIIAPTGIGTKANGRFGIQRKPQIPVLVVGQRVYDVQAVEDGIGFRDFFCGLLFATFLG